MTIGALAKAAGVGVETVRFYQRKGLLETPARTTGYRTYSDSDARTIKFIKKVQELGFSLKDAQELLDIAFCSKETRPRLAKACDRKVEEIHQKINDLHRMLKMVHQFSNACGSETPNDSPCNLLDCFENDWECCETSERKAK
ncbi:MAG: MerR family transcriptional regulator [Rhodopirellula sp. JB055]|uniref:MerR family transcriptional regulator n=1 Tax=Rhodopirellula sp. JB055 TaxID=3342846 RepID=UPI00370CA66B